MNLTDQEILELSSFCDALVDGTISDARKAELCAWLRRSEEARRLYVRSMAMSASLHTYAAEMMTSASDVIALPKKRSASSLWKWMAPSALAASLMLAFWVVEHRRPEAVDADRPDEFVARLTASKDCQWGDGEQSPALGDHLPRGRSLELAAGWAEVTFDSGAQVVVEGPSLIELDSAWGASLRRGTLKASVPPQAIGFRISNPSVEVVDLGTEFTMIADGSGATEVLVLKGAVEADPHRQDQSESLVMHENESLRFSPQGISEVANSELKFARFNKPLALEKFAAMPNYAHWSFDEAEGGMFEAATVGLPWTRSKVTVHEMVSKEAGRMHAKGRWNEGLRFDGQHYAVAPFPGLSANGARTIAFWTKISSDTQLSEAYAMVAWLPSGPKLQFHPIHIGWNRNPSEGAVGVLRTDYARGYALGSTPLRNGRWHHVAVVFVPGSQADNPLQVKLYLDGRFEGEGRPSPPGWRADSTKTPEDYTGATRDRLWLGCRLGSDGPRNDRFRGMLDELFVADRELEPAEIVQLMYENKLALSQVVRLPVDDRSGNLLASLHGQQQTDSRFVPMQSIPVKAR